MQDQSYACANRTLHACAAVIGGLILFGPALAAATTIYTADEGQGTVSVFDSERGPVATVAVGVTPHNVDLTPDGHTLLRQAPTFE